MIQEKGTKKLNSILSHINLIFHPLISLIHNYQKLNISFQDYKHNLILIIAQDFIHLIKEITQQFSKETQKIFQIFIHK